MKPITKKLQLTALAVSLSASVGFGFWQWQQQQSAQTHFDIALRWTVGNLQRYQLNTHSIVRQDNPLSSTTTTEQMQLHSLLDVETLGTEKGSVLIGMQLSKIDLLVNAQFDSDTSQALATPFRVRFSQIGMPLEFEFPNGVSAKHRTILENIVRLFQLNLQKDDTWQARESNAHGTYSASYQRVGPREFRKHKHDFQLATVNNTEPASNIESNEQLRIDQQQDWIATMLVNESLLTQQADGTKIKISNMASLELSPFSPAINRDVWAFTTTSDVNTMLGGPQQ